MDDTAHLQSYSQQETPLGDLRRAKVASIAAQVDEYEALLPYLTYQEQAELDQLLAGIEIPIWEPFAGPQQQALDCEADDLFYGGAAGGGKTDLLLGASLTRHWRSIIFRREYAELKGIRERSDELFENIGRFNGQLELWRITEGEYKGVRVEFGACQFEGDERKFQGRPHDLKAFDEITQFTEAQFRFLITWNRTTRVGQRVRIIATGNPPTNAEGQWVVKYWAPWLDPKHPNPAKQGELRWFIQNAAGEDEEVPNADPVCITYADGEEDLVFPRSRTFIRARVEDNPRLMETGYRRILQGLPEPLRSRMLRGDFNVGVDEDEWQIIPTDWVLKAQARWAPTFEAFLLKQRYELKARRADTDEDTDPNQIPGEDPEESLEEDISAEESRDTRLRASHGFAASQSEVRSSRGSHASRPEPAIPESLLGLSGAGGGGVSAFAKAKMDQSIPLGPSTPEEFQEARERAEAEGSVGIDVSRGGKDETVYSDRLANWFAPLIVIPGKNVRDGADVIQVIVDRNLQNRRLHVDVTGVGTSPVDIGRMLNMNVVAMVGAEKSNRKDRSGKLGFANARSDWWWGMREALDPALGEDIGLPPDPDILNELTAVRWSLTARGIQAEGKEKIKERLGRSPNKGDAIVMAHAEPYLAGRGFLKFAKEQSDEARAEEERAKTRTGALESIRAGSRSRVRSPI